MDNPDIRRGMVIRPDAGDLRWTIARITDNENGFVPNVLTGAIPALAATSDFTIVTPQLRNSFLGTIRSGEAFDLPAEGAMNKTLAITPSSDLTGWSILPSGKNSLGHSCRG